ncbi:MAG TPA: hypothetical protein VKV20_05615 [Ktedonobacteraceae bacterium]|nr:hypothetical protein [Ktedonobacteraceae bacterium]
MPTLASTGEITPKSALRHRPIGKDTDEPGKGPAHPPVAPVAQRASRRRPKHTEDDGEMKPKQTEDGVEVSEWQRAGDDETKGTHTPDSLKRVPTAPKSLPKLPRVTAAGNKRGFTYRAHPLLYLGVGMIAMLALWTLLTSVIGWANTTMDDIRYGRPRTFQIDAVVGHNDSPANPSHYIAINYNSRIEVIEFPGGDASKARIYLGPQLFGSGEDLAPVTLSFADVNGDHRPDMIIHFQSTQIVFINDQGGFRPLRPDEQPAVEQFLQKHGL